jgi:hypothetical protein
MWGRQYTCYILNLGGKLGEKLKPKRGVSILRGVRESIFLVINWK